MKNYLNQLSKIPVPYTGPDEENPITQEDPNASLGQMPEQVDFIPPMEQTPSLAPTTGLNKILERYLELKTPTQPDLINTSRIDEALKAKEQAGVYNNLLRASMMANEAIAQSRGAKVPVNEQALQALEQQASQPLEGLKTRIQTKDIVEEQDPNSDISKFARERAKEMMKRINPNFDIAQFDKMSASQLKNLGFKFDARSQQQQQPEVRFERVLDESGNVRLKAFDKTTGQEVRDLGAAGFANQFRADPRTGEIIALSPSTVDIGPRQITGPKSGGEKTTKSEQPLTPLEIKNKVDKNTFDVIQKTKEDFNKETEEARKVVAGLEGTKKMLDLAEKNPAGKPIAAAAITRLFEKGVLTDKDVERYVVRQGLFNSAEDYSAQLSSGTFSKEQVKQLAQALDAYKQQQQTQIKNIAAQKAENVSGYIDPSTGVTSKDLSNMIYTTPKIDKNDKVRVKSPKGQIGLIPRQNLEKALKAGYTEVK